MHACELQLDVTLLGGMSFMWHQCIDGEFVGCIGSTALALRQTDRGAEFRLLSSNVSAKKAQAVLLTYFNSDISRAELDGEWSQLHHEFALRARLFRGCRVLQVPLLECCVCFLGSTQNVSPPYLVGNIS